MVLATPDVGPDGTGRAAEWQRLSQCVKLDLFIFPNSSGADITTLDTSLCVGTVAGTIF